MRVDLRGDKHIETGENSRRFYITLEIISDPSSRPDFAPANPPASPRSRELSGVISSPRFNSKRPFTSCSDESICLTGGNSRQCGEDSTKNQSRVWEIDRMAAHREDKKSSREEMRIRKAPSRSRLSSACSFASSACDEIFTEDGKVSVG